MQISTKGGIENPWKFKAGVEPAELLQRNFDNKRMTKLLAHGWNTNGLTFSTPFVKEIFQNPNLNSNIIAVDYRFVRLL